MFLCSRKSFYTVQARWDPAWSRRDPDIVETIISIQVLYPGGKTFQLNNFSLNNNNKRRSCMFNIQEHNSIYL